MTLCTDINRRYKSKERECRGGPVHVYFYNQSGVVIVPYYIFNECRAYNIQGTTIMSSVLQQQSLSFITNTVPLYPMNVEASTTDLCGCQTLFFLIISWWKGVSIGQTKRSRMSLLVSFMNRYNHLDHSSAVSSREKIYFLVI